MAQIYFENGVDVGPGVEIVDGNVVTFTDAELNQIADFMLSLPSVQACFTSPPPHVDSITVRNSRSVTVT